MWLEPVKVLVVDDHVDTADTIKLLLDSIGHDVRVAYTGPEALAIAEEHGPELAILDIQLQGGMTGYELARQLRGAAGPRPMGLIALTGWNARTECLDAGFDRYVLKPVDSVTLDLNMRLARELYRGAHS